MKRQTISRRHCFLICCSLIIGISCSNQKADENSFTTAGSSTSQKEKDKANPNRNLVVATVGETKITVGMIDDEINQQNPYLRMRFSSPERKKEFLKNYIRFEVLAQEARRRNLQQDPEVIKRVKRAMIDRLIEELHTSLVTMKDITDKEVEEYYQKNITQYKQPAKVRASQIVTKTEAEAKQVLTLAKKKPTDSRFFGELVAKYSIDEPSKARHGDLDFFANDAANIPQTLRDAVFGIKGIWQLGGPVKTAQGYVVFMKTGEIDAVNHPLSMEKDRIKNRLFNERRMKGIEKYIEELQTKAKVEINEANLAKVKAELSPSPMPVPMSPKIMPPAKSNVPTKPNVPNNPSTKN